VKNCHFITENAIDNIQEKQEAIQELAHLTDWERIFPAELRW